MSGHKITMLGTGLIGMFYTMTLHGGRGRDRVEVVYSRSAERAAAFAQEWGIPRWTTNMAEAINDPETDTVVVGIPNYVHKEAVLLAAQAGKRILCTKPLARNAAEAKEMLDAVEKAGVWAGYLEDLVYTPKTLKALAAVKNGAWDFLEKPFQNNVLVDKVEEALAAAASRLDDTRQAERLRQALASLSPREREVLDELIAGHYNKNIADHLGITPRTVEFHRANIFDKLGVHSAVELAHQLGRLQAADRMPVPDTPGGPSGPGTPGGG